MDWCDETMNLMQTLCLLLGLVLASPAWCSSWAYETLEADDGVPLTVVESGNPNGLPVLFVHGYSQSLLSWKQQLNDEVLKAKFRMVAFDLRGHGASGKPWGEGAYSGERWADDLDTVISGKALDKPVLVGWSFGGSVLMSFLRHQNWQTVSGLVFVAGAMTMQAEVPLGDEGDNALPAAVRALLHDMALMTSPDIAVNLEGTSGFVGRLAAQPMSDSERLEALAYNMMLPAYVRRAMFAHRLSFETLAGRISLPTLLIHGTEDELIPIARSELNESLIPDAHLVPYEGVGHAPFLEASERFNSDLLAFVERVTRP